jgi:hypothetical protein
MVKLYPRIVAIASTAEPERAMLVNRLVPVLMRIDAGLPDKLATRACRSLVRELVRLMAVDEDADAVGSQWQPHWRSHREVLDTVRSKVAKYADDNPSLGAYFLQHQALTLDCLVDMHDEFAGAQRSSEQRHCVRKLVTFLFNFLDDDNVLFGESTDATLYEPEIYTLILTGLQRGLAVEGMACSDLVATLHKLLHLLFQVQPRWLEAWATPNLPRLVDALLAAIARMRDTPAQTRNAIANAVRVLRMVVLARLDAEMETEPVPGVAAIANTLDPLPDWPELKELRQAQLKERQCSAPDIAYLPCYEAAAQRFLALSVAAPSAKRDAGLQYLRDLLSGPSAGAPALGAASQLCADTHARLVLELHRLLRTQTHANPTAAELLADLLGALGPLPKSIVALVDAEERPRKCSPSEIVVDILNAMLGWVRES